MRGEETEPDLTDTRLKWSRRKDARPAEIIEAAVDVFVVHGFAAAKLSDVATRAGVVKGTLYRYFETKEDLFRAVVQHVVDTNLAALEQVAQAFRGSLFDLVPVLLKQAADGMADGHVPALARMVIGESRAFPDLARIWHDKVVSRVLALLAGLVAAAQARGEVRAGDPTVHAFSIVGPMVTGLLFREVFGPAGPHAPDLGTLAEQHAATVMRGLAPES